MLSTRLNNLMSYTEMTYCKKLKNKEGLTVYRAIKDIFEKNGLRPRMFLSDAGREYFNKHVSKYLEELGVRQYKTSSITKASIAERGESYRLMNI